MPYIKINDCNYYYELRNDKLKSNHDKESILLVHGHPFDHTMWRYQYESLGEYRLILPDLKGYGKTDFSFEKIYIEDQAQALRSLVEHLQIQSVHLIGLSMGGQIIVEFARLFPEITKSLVICCSNPSGETEESYQKRLNLADRIEAIGMESYTWTDIYKYLHQQTIKNCTPEYKHLFKMMLNTKVKGAVASLRGRAERRCNLSFLEEIRKPVLVIAGDSDYFTPPDEMKMIASKIKDADFVCIDDAGHMPNMEQATKFNEALKSFYGKRIISSENCNKANQIL